ncbi:hypothetical protein TEQG_05952 [Trichophyton equinum CBS 127.97]|uniref:Secreted protein n=1 Tax=Trichophyton equinum (strain ATCC MYA-4606 / CBS 127.97) TaxID=559882 RepID=F2PYD1_TRIEC|nr:hypothetical protein TEQG_05952 [Trichophyton equinum CBS 127.97]
MKVKNQYIATFISIVALLAPVVLADSGWIDLIKEKCPHISAQCLDVADKAHQPGFNVVEATQAAKIMPICNPAYDECSRIILDDAEAFPPGSPQGNPVTCVLQLAPDHFKYFLDNDSADIPIPRNQNCPLRELHRVAHVDLGPLA